MADPWDSDAVVTAAPSAAAAPWDADKTVTSPKPVYDAARFKQIVGRAPQGDELANYQRDPANFGDTAESQPGMSIGKIATQAVPAAGELGLTTLTGAAAAPFAAGRYVLNLPQGLDAAAKAADETQNKYTYTPRTDLAQGIEATVGQLAQAPAQVYQAAAQLGAQGAQKLGLPTDPQGSSDFAGREADVATHLAPLTPLAAEAGAFARGGGVTRSLAQNVRAAANELLDRLPDPEGLPAASAQTALDAAAARSPENMGAARSSPQVAAASPELQNAIAQQSAATNGQLNQTALQRQLQADSVGVNLTRGQATGDPVRISEERNMRGQVPELADMLNAQNGQLVGKLQDLRDHVGPEVFSTNPVEHGDTLIKAYQDKAAAAQDQITAAYKALKDASGGQFPIDAPQLYANATKALNNDLKFDIATSSPELAPVMKTLSKLAENDNMTFQNFESMRTNLANIMRSSANGNVKAAAGIIRDQMESLPMAPEQSGAVKVLADNARALAKQQFDAVAADPAYDAALHGTVAPGDFTRRFVVNQAVKNPAALQTMAANLADNDAARQTMAVSVLDHLRDQAGVGPGQPGNFRAATFNKALQALDPGMRTVVGPQAADTLADLGDVARYTHEQPAGSFVNNSNSLVAALAGHVGNVAAEALPFGRLAKSAVGYALDKASAARYAREATQVGAGIGDVPRPQSPAVMAMLNAARRKLEQEAAAAAIAKRALGSGPAAQAAMAGAAGGTQPP